jgi:hypothetical protein
MKHSSKHFKLSFLETRSVEKMREDKSMQFCCDDLKSGLFNPRASIKYESRFREYWLEPQVSIGVLDHSMRDRWIDLSESISMTIVYCPWCRQKLPKDLLDEFFQILKTEYQINATIDDVWKDYIKFPKEFYTDEWWKKRGL